METEYELIGKMTGVLSALTLKVMTMEARLDDQQRQIDQLHTLIISRTGGPPR